MEILKREDRVHLAAVHYGLYTIGMAATTGELIDENCAMDNMRVPYYVSDLNEKHKQCLAERDFYNNFVGPKEDFLSFPGVADFFIANKDVIETIKNM